MCRLTRFFFLLLCIDGFFQDSNIVFVSVPPAPPWRCMGGIPLVAFDLSLYTCVSDEKNWSTNSCVCRVVTYFLQIA